MTPEKKSVRTRALAVYARESVLQLGPTFIKLGQLFATRSDLISAEFVEELAKLQVCLFPPAALRWLNVAIVSVNCSMPHTI